MNRQVLWGLVGLAALATSALAQESQPAQNGAPPARQRRQGGPGGPGQMGRRGPNLPESLKLTDEQKAKVAEIQQTAFREMFQQGNMANNRDQFQKMRDLRTQMQQAAQAGDETKVAELQGELDNMSFTQSQKQMQEKIDSQIAEILTPEQRHQFEQWKKLRDSGLPPRLIDNPEALKTAVLNIKSLSDVQKNGVEAAFERYDRGSVHGDEVTKATLKDQFANEVLLILKPSQKVLLTSAAMRGPGGPGGRQGRGGGRNGGNNGAAPAGDTSGGAAGGAPAAPQTPATNQ
jgi:Spy/CpxP family protein refolding chaperone